MLRWLHGKQQQQVIFPPCLPVHLLCNMSSHFVIQRDISVQFFQYDPETETILAKVAVNKRVNIFNIVS